MTNAPNQMGQVQLSYGSRTYPSGSGFDAQGRQRSLTNWSAFPSDGSRATAWNYNQYRGYLDNKRYPDNAGPNYAYTAAGRLPSRLWARGTNTTYSWNNAGDLSGTTYNDDPRPHLEAHSIAVAGKSQSPKAR